MRKTLLITLEFPPFAGGVGNYYYNLVKRLPADKIHVLTAEKSKHNENYNFKIFRKTLITKLPFKPKWLTALLKSIYYVKKEGIEQLWAGQVLPLGTVCLIIKKIFNLPYFVSCHGTDILTAQKNKKKRELAVKILKEAKFITANSHFTKNEIIKLGIEDNKIIVIYPCPNDLPEINQKTANEIKIKYSLENKKIILSVGRLVERKGFSLVINSLAPLLKSHPDLIYLIIGNGPKEKELDLLIKKLNLINQIRILTKINNNELAHLFNLCEIFILTPYELFGEIEGFGMVYLEAGLFSKPVIASRSGGVPEAVIENMTGILVNPEKTEEISKAINLLLFDKNLAFSLGRAGHENAIRNFQWANEIKKIINIL